MSYLLLAIVYILCAYVIVHSLFRLTQINRSKRFLDTIMEASESKRITPLQGVELMQQLDGVGFTKKREQAMYRTMIRMEKRNKTSDVVKKAMKKVEL